MASCPTCSSALEITHLRCPACRLELGGGFQQSRVARLSAEQQRLTEQLVLSSGNLKLLAQQQAVSYPTLRKRLDELIEALQVLGRDDEQRRDAILARVERNEMPPEQAARMIRELDGGA